MDLEWDPRNKTSFGQLTIFLEQKWGHTYLSVDDFGVIKELDRLSIEKYTNNHIVTIHTKPTAIVQPTFHYEEMGTEWIVYPWENDDSETIADYKK